VDTIGSKEHTDSIPKVALDDKIHNPEERNMKYTPLFSSVSTAYTYVLQIYRLFFTVTQIAAVFLWF